MADLDAKNVAVGVTEEYEDYDGTHHARVVAAVPSRIQTTTAVIADGGTNSAAIDCRGRVATHVLVPAGFEGTSLKPQGSFDGTNFFDIYEHDDTDASAVTLTVAASRIYALPLSEMWGLLYVRFVADAQTGAATLTVALA